ncbi:MAG TPA: hypothetical protein VIO38_00660 [Rariglobus sp.]
MVGTDGTREAQIGVELELRSHVGGAVVVKSLGEILARAFDVAEVHKDNPVGRPMPSSPILRSIVWERAMSSKPSSLGMIMSVITTSNRISPWHFSPSWPSRPPTTACVFFKGGAKHVPQCIMVLDE